jgi:hypothetical protein
MTKLVQPMPGVNLVGAGVVEVAPLFDPFGATICMRFSAGALKSS